MIKNKEDEDIKEEEIEEEVEVYYGDYYSY